MKKEPGDQQPIGNGNIWEVSVYLYWIIHLYDKIVNYVFELKVKITPPKVTASSTTQQRYIDLWVNAW